jgi:hypothetical protein
MMESAEYLGVMKADLMSGVRFEATARYPVDLLWRGRGTESPVSLKWR